MHYLVSYETEKLYSLSIFLIFQFFFKLLLFEKPILEKNVTFSCLGIIGFGRYEEFISFILQKKISFKNGRTKLVMNYEL